MNKVLVLRKILLPISETFIKEQIEALQRWDATLVGEVLVGEGQDLTGLSWIKIDNLSANKKTNSSIESVVKKILPEIIHIHFAVDATYFIPRINTFKGPILITLHGYDITINKEYWLGHEREWARRYPENLLDISLRPNVYFIAVSKAIKQSAIDFGIPESKIVVKYIGVNQKRFTPRETSISSSDGILFVGRLVEKKGIMILLSALLKIYNKSKSFRPVLTIAGTGYQEEEAKEFVRRHNLRVIFLGAVSYSDVCFHMKKSRVLCLPSISAENGDREGFGLVLLEAQATGLPVVTSAHGGALEGVVHGKTGFAFEEKDVDSLVNYLLLILQDSLLAEQMSYNAIEYVSEKFDLHKCTHELECLYDEVIYKDLDVDK